MKLNLNWSFLTILSLATMTLFSCEKEQTMPAESTDDNNEVVVAILDDALSSSTSGLMSETEVAVELAAKHMIKSGNNSACGTPFDSSLVVPYNNAFITGTYSANWAWTVNCNNFSLPISIELASTSSNIYETRTTNANSESASSWLIDNLLTGEYFEFSGNYEREGIFTVELKETHTWNSSFSFNLQSLRFDKATLEAEGGEATFQFEGVTAQNTEINVNGTIEFIGKDKAIITINGKTYEIDLN